MGYGPWAQIQPGLDPYSLRVTPLINVWVSLLIRFMGAALRKAAPKALVTTTGEDYVNG